MDNNLKDYREKELKNYVIGNALIIIVLLGIFNTLLDVKMDESTNNILLTQKETCRSMEQNRKPRDKSTHIWTPYL